MNPYRRFRTKDIDLNRVQDRVEDTFRQFVSNPLLDGVFIDVVFPSGSLTQEINHTLTRQPLGWIVVDVDAAETLHRDSWNNRTLTLTASGAVSAKLYVF